MYQIIRKSLSLLIGNQQSVSGSWPPLSTVSRWTRRKLAVDSPEEIVYGLLADFVADFRDPSVHKKKARIWCLHRFFHFLTVTGVVPENTATGLPYPKIEKTVPHILTAKGQKNRIL